MLYRARPLLAGSRVVWCFETPPKDEASRLLDTGRCPQGSGRVAQIVPPNQRHVHRVCELDKDPRKRLWAERETTGRGVTVARAREIAPVTWWGCENVVTRVSLGYFLSVVVPRPTTLTPKTQVFARSLALSPVPRAHAPRDATVAARTHNTPDRRPRDLGGQYGAHRRPERHTPQERHAKRTQFFRERDARPPRFLRPAPPPHADAKRGTFARALARRRNAPVVSEKT